VLARGVRSTVVVIAVAAIASVAILAAGGCASGGATVAASDLHPRVQVSLQPPAPIPLDTGWRYTPDPNDVGLSRDWARGVDAGAQATPVTLPTDFNPTMSSGGDRGTVGWYELRFTAPPTSAGRSWSIRFDEVRRTAEVWLNGRELGRNTNPFAPFSLPAGPLRPGGSNLLVVRVDNFMGAGAFPQDWWNWGGIVQGVTLQPVGRLALDDLGVMPELGCRYRCGDLLVQGAVHNVSGRALRPELVVRVASPSGATWTVVRRLPSAVLAGRSVQVAFRVRVPGRPVLWSPASPSLYRVEVATMAGSRVEQISSLRVGMRSVQVRGGILYLNGRRLWLHGAAIHEDVSGRGAALSDGDINTIVSELRSVGANITRAHYLLSGPLLDALDAAGILVWSQAPVDHADALLASRAGRRRALALLRATIIGERSHPSVIVDSVANELTPDPDAAPGTRSYLDQAISLARRLNPAAVVGLDTYGLPGYQRQDVYTKLDVLGIDSYYGWYGGPRGHRIARFAELEPFLRASRAQFPRQALVITEFGAEGLYDGPASVKGTYEFQSAYIERTLGVLDRLPFMNGSIYWILRDFAVAPGWIGGASLPQGFAPDGLNHKGLIGYDGSQKPAFAVAVHLFARTPGFVR
jgi:hypothetical protein